MKSKYAALGVTIPLLYIAFSYGIHWAAFNNFQLCESTQIWNFSFPKDHHFELVIILLTISLHIFGGFGEEIGLRGFLFPNLNEMFGFKKAAFISGVIWSIWHWPFMIVRTYQSGNFLALDLLLFTITITALGFAMSYLRLKSGSVWPAVLFHASNNFFDQNIFGIHTKTDVMPYMVSETGILTLVVSVAITVICVRLSKSKEFQNEKI